MTFLYTDDRLTLDNVNCIVKEVEQWEEIGLYMKDRGSQIDFWK